MIDHNLVFDCAIVYLYGEDSITQYCPSCQQHKEFYSRKKYLKKQYKTVVVPAGKICKDCTKQKNKHEYRRNNPKRNN